MMFLVGPDTWGVQTDEYHTTNPETKGHCGDGGRCDETLGALSVGQPGHFAPPPPSPFMGQESATFDETNCYLRIREHCRNLLD
jgi:hypothetical protein